MVIFDTNIIIEHLRAEEFSILWEMSRENYQDTLAISIVTIQELYTGRSTRKNEEEERLLSVISPLKILEYSYDIAQKAGELRRDYKEAIDFPDSIIAATSLLHDAQLATLNKKHFKGIRDLKLAF